MRQAAFRSPHLPTGVAERATDLLERRFDRDQPAEVLKALEQVGEIGHKGITTWAAATVLPSGADEPDHQVWP